MKHRIHSYEDLNKDYNRQSGGKCKGMRNKYSFVSEEEKVSIVGF